MKSFELAFIEAQKLGLDKFEYNGKWYSTKLTSKLYVPSHVSTQIYKDINPRKYGTYKPKEYTEFVVTAPRKKITGKESDFLPVTSRTDELTGRIFKNYNTGVYYVVDNYGNIIGDTLDPRAANNGFMAFNIYTGSTSDMQRIGASEYRNRANLNESNLRALLKYLRELIGEEGILLDIHTGMTAAANTINLTLNTPAHSVLGLLRVGTNYFRDPEDRYTFDDYLRGFDLNHAYRPLGQTFGVEAITDFMPEGPVKDIIDIGGAMAVRSLPYGLTRTTLVSRKPGTTISYGYNVRLTKTVDPYWLNSGYKPGLIMFRLNPKGYSSRRGGVTIHRNPITDKLLLRQLDTGRFIPTRGLSIEEIIKTTPETFTYSHPLRFNFNGTWLPVVLELPESPSQQQYVPTMIFEYPLGEVNPTVQGRIVTGDFVPGTTSPNWNGGIGGGKVRISNTSGYEFPIFEGVVAAPAVDYTSDRYLNEGN